MTRSEAQKLYGTDQTLSEIVTLKAGSISLELDGGALRYIRYGGHEAIRGVDYLVRDDSWRTPPAKLTPVTLQQSEDGFLVEIDGEVKQDDIHYRYRLRIEGDPQKVEMRADAEALSGFSTNRTGFVVLHPIVGVSGRPVTVTRKDGTTTEMTFPELISPGQPIFEIRALRHEVSPGVFCACLMEAALPHDPETIYEMEDHRNWTDASYKTYVGSLLDPWPYRIEAGQKVTQRVVVSFEGAPAQTTTGGAGGASLLIGEVSGALPRIGLGQMPAYRAPLQDAGHPALELKPAFITAYIETDDGDMDRIIADYRAIAAQLDAGVQLEIVLPQGRSTAVELGRVAQSCAAAGLVPTRVIASPGGYLKSIQPVGPWPEVTDLGHIYNQCRIAFPQSTIVGGMLSYFTELNRKRPPMATVDALSCTTAPIVHAADDRSVMETIEAIPAVITSMAAMSGGKPLHLGPTAIGMRHNPYGAATADNPHNERIAMAENDPRQTGLFGAAWSVGYAAAVAGSEAVSSLALNHLAGPSGLAADNGELYPAYHVMRALCAASGAPRVALDLAGSGLSGIAWKNGELISMLIANLSAQPITLQVPQGLSGMILDLESFDVAASDLDWSNTTGPAVGSVLTLGAYATLFAQT